MHVEGTYTIEDWKQETYSEPAPALARADVVLRYQGGLAGKAETVYLMTNLPEGSAHFVGQIRFTGTIGDRKGSFVMHETGQYNGTNVAMGELSIVAGSGTGDFSGIRGSGAYVASHGHEEVDFAGRNWQPTPEREARYVFDIVYE